MSAANRHQSRILAVQGLYQYNLLKLPKEKIKNFALDSEAEITSETRQYAEELIDGTLEQMHKIEEIIGHHLDMGKVEDLKVIDRSILQMSVFGLLHCKDIPSKVTINEAVILAKEFGSKNSFRFINGIMDAINTTLK